MEKDDPDTKRTVNLVIESMKRFKLEFETACVANGVDPSDMEAVKDAVESMGVAITKNIKKIEQRAVKKYVGDVCGNEKEIGAILNFINDRASKRLLVIGKENAGKTITVDEAFKSSGAYHEDVYDIKDFLVKAHYNTRRLMPIIFILDVSGVEKNYVGSKQFKKLLEGSIESKVIVVSREMDESLVSNFDVAVEVRSPGFTETYDFLLQKDPGLLEGVDRDKAAKVFDESGRSIFGFVKAMLSKDYAPDISKSDFDLAIKLCASIYKDPDRNSVKAELSKHLKLNEKDKSDSMFKMIPYFGFLEHYVVENTYRYFEPSGAAFFDVALLLDRIHKRRYYLEIDEIVDLLAHGIPHVESKDPIILPYIHEYLVYVKNKKNVKFKKKKSDDAE